MRRFGYIAASLAVALTLYGPVIAQDSSVDSQSKPPDATATVSNDQQPTSEEQPTPVKTGASVSSQELANQVNNPAAPVTFIQFRDILLPNPSKTKGAVNALQMQPVLPIGPFHSFPHVQLMKITLPLVISTPGIAPPIRWIGCGSGTQGVTGLGDLQIFDLVTFKQSWGQVGLRPRVNLSYCYRNTTRGG